MNWITRLLRRTGPPLADRYRVAELIGRGASGRVYKAHDTRLNRMVAIKILEKAAVEDASQRARFGREVQAMAAVSHPHVVPIYDVFEDDHEVGLVMELVSGGDLRARLQSPLELGEALLILRQVADALAELHRLGIVHRDLKPANVLISRTGYAKVSDFGIADISVLAARADADTDSTLTELTKVGQILGTPSYMSPEQVLGQPVGPPSDIFALGSILYEMLVGKHPFAGDSVSAVANAILKHHPPPPSACGLAVPSDIESLLVGMLTKDPSDRTLTPDGICTSVNRILAANSRSALVHQSLAPEVELLDGRYRLEELINSDLRSVWRAYDTHLHRTVAIKMWGSLESEPQSLGQHSEHGLGRLGKLHHPGIVRPHDIIYDDAGFSYEIEEFLEGPTLEALIHDDVLSMHEKSRVLCDIAEIVEYAHGRGVQHLDFHTHNVRLERGGVVRITDFGMMPTGNASGLVGKTSILAPEQIRSEYAGKQSDVWMFGVLMYKLLTRDMPFNGGNIQELIGQITQHAPKSPRQLNRAIPDELEYICLKCLEKSLDHRYAMMADVKFALQQAHELGAAA